MKHFFLKTVLFIFAFTLSNCEKNDPEEQLPPITQTGANTFGAIVDGRAFTPADSFSTTPGTPKFKGLQVYVGNNFKTSNGDDKWTISTGNFKINPSIYLYIYIPSLKDLSTNYIVDSSDGLEDSDLSNAHIYCHINGNNNTYLSTVNSGIIEFTRLDIANGIYSGTLSVKLKNKDDENDIIEITNGRFDINLNTVNK
ncbi:hypothetical protein JL193_15195 [Polaribacter batillariae]|uniref:Lipoprotein n=1 Tax=Polaribacter batillariae TaxID=2808900 RepID=A0ABX7SVB3_9FLAO|nr:hypothetical protein [Polaribacter batillariae]QTD37418.1 hypothetical protein JL193_15195 [Polaribacter batillariae]